MKKPNRFRQCEAIDPAILDRLVWHGSTWKPIPRRRKIPLATLKRLSWLRRALQSLPPRELQFVYLHQVKGYTQQEMAEIGHVKQQNISYRMIRASERIQLHYRIFCLVSETQLRRTLFDLGFDMESARVAAGVIRTSSQASVATVLGYSPGYVRDRYRKMVVALERHRPGGPELQLLRLVERNLNRLGAIKCQPRWAHKQEGAGKGNRPREACQKAEPEVLLERMFA